jgi:hypothetical protein
MKVDGYDIDVVIQGYPGKSVCHGGLGCSNRKRRAQGSSRGLPVPCRNRRLGVVSSA